MKTAQGGGPHQPALAHQAARLQTTPEHSQEAIQPTQMARPRHLLKTHLTETLLVQSIPKRKPGPPGAMAVHGDAEGETVVWSRWAVSAADFGASAGHVVWQP